MHAEKLWDNLHSLRGVTMQKLTNRARPFRAMYDHCGRVNPGSGVNNEKISLAAV